MRHILLSLTVLLCLGTQAFSQSAWTQDKGKHYMQLSHSVLPFYTKYYQRGGNEEQTAREVLDQTLQFYGEYGMGPSTTLLYNLPVKHVHIGNFNANYEGSASLKAGTMWGLSNAMIGVRQSLYSDLFNMGIEFQIQAPTGMYDDSMGVRTGYDAWSFYPTLNFGKGLGNFYIKMYIGSQLRTNDYTHNLTTGVEAGYKFFDRLWVMAFLNGQVSWRNGDRVDPINNRATGLYLNDQEFVAFGLKLIGEVVKDKFGITFGFGGAISGHNVAKSPSWNGGIYWQWAGKTEADRAIEE